MSSFVHISQEDPETGRGGVAKFARYLKRAVPELGFVSHQFSHNRPWKEIAEANKVVLREYDPADTVVIADGYYGLGLAGKVKKLIVVCHSTYAGWMRDNLMLPIPGYDNSWLWNAAKAQEEAYRDADEIASVSGSAQEELWQFYDLESRLIRNGVDLDEYVPAEEIRTGSIVEVAGADPNKGSDIISLLKNKGGLDIAPLGYSGDEAKRWHGHHVAVLPSRHEGGPYAQLEAMACNLSIVAYRSGYFKSEVPERYFLGTYDLYWGTFKRLIAEAMEGDLLNPREWVMDHANFNLFKTNWRNLLEVDNDDDKA